MLPKVSVITVTYNCVGDIESTMQSVFEQDYPNLEYIIIDGGSSDGTMDIVNRYKSRLSFLLSEADVGIYDAMNKGLKFASGQWCAFMNAGDTFHQSDVISRLFEGIPEESELRVVYGNTAYLYSDGHSIDHPTADINHLPRIISRYQPYCHQAVFYNISDKSDCQYDLRYAYAADYDVACRYYKRYGISSYHYVPIRVCNFKAYDGASTNRDNQYRLHKEVILIKIRNRMCVTEIIKDTLRLIVHK